MSMTLKRIELWNIRAHEHLVFEPDPEGVTSVSGANGAGKSTIVDAFAWGLYGTKTNNIKNKMLIRDKADIKKDKVQVEVQIIINRIEYLVRRTILGAHGGAECNVYGRQEGSDEEFNHLAGPAISSAESFIKQAIKMDEKGFLTSVLIQQKQVDQIVSDSASKRAEVIEKLTGIQAITNAITLAREEANALKKAASVITLEDTDTLEKVILEEIDTGTALKKKTDNDKVAIQEMKLLVNEKVKKYHEEEAKNKKGKEIAQVKAVNKERLKLQSQEMKSLMDLVSEYRKETKTVVTEDLSSIEKNLNNINSLLSSKNSDLIVTSRNIESTSSEIDAIEKMMESIDGNISDKLQSVRAEILNASEEIETLNKELYSIKAEEKQAKKSMSTLGDGLTNCPVCKSHIEDPDELKDEIERELKEMKVRVKAINSESKALELTLKGLKEEEDSLRNTEVESERLRPLQEELEMLRSTQSLIEDELKDLESKASVYDKQYKKAVQVASRVDEVNRAKERVKALNEEMKTANSMISKADEAIENLSPLNDRALAGLRLETEKDAKTLEKLSIEWSRENERLIYLRARVEDLKAQYSSAVTANEKYNQLTDTMKQANVAGSLMSEFKESRIKYAIPALEMYASTILSKFTDGDFVKVSLDPKFNTFVTTSEGVVRSTSQLSGGEVSAVAIALRVGISMLLTEGESNVLILDEILVSMDKDRARQIIETITSITNCQVIFIAHNANIQEVADVIVQI